MDNKVYLPVNIPRLVKNVKAKHLSSRGEKCCFSPVEAVQKVEELVDRIQSMKGKDGVGRQVQENSCFLMVIMIRLHLASKRVCLKEGLSLEMLDVIIGDIESKYLEA